MRREEKRIRRFMLCSASHRGSLRGSPGMVQLVCKPFTARQPLAPQSTIKFRRQMWEQKDSCYHWQEITRVSITWQVWWRENRGWQLQTWFLPHHQRPRKAEAERDLSTEDESGTKSECYTNNRPNFDPPFFESVCSISAFLLYFRNLYQPASWLSGGSLRTKPNGQLAQGTFSSTGPVIILGERLIIQK